MYELFGYSGEDSYTPQIMKWSLIKFDFIGPIKLLYVNFSFNETTLIAIHTPGFSKLYFHDPKTGLFEPVPNGGEDEDRRSLVTAVLIVKLL